MVTTKYGNLPNEVLENYLNKLISRVFKILPLRESEFSTLPSYLESLNRELIGSKELIEELKFDADFCSLVSTLEFFINNEVSVSVYKKEVFNCINLIKKLQEKHNNKN